VETDRQLVRFGNLIKETLETKGWQEIIGPLIDKMIQDVVGAKVGGRWQPGAFGDKRLSNASAENLIWYRQALIELHEHIFSYLDAAEGAKKRKKGKKDKVIVPMLSGSYSGVSSVTYNYGEDEGAMIQ